MLELYDLYKHGTELLGTKNCLNILEYVKH